MQGSQQWRWKNHKGRSTGGNQEQEQETKETNQDFIVLIKFIKKTTKFVNGAYALSLYIGLILILFEIK